MPVDPEEKHGERARVHDAQAVRLAGRERERRILVEPHPTGRAGGGEVCPVLSKVDEGGVCGKGVRDSEVGKRRCGRCTWNGLSAAGVSYAEELGGEGVVLAVVPVQG